MATKKARRSKPGLPADAEGVDPTQNVKDLSDASNIRQDDLRGLTKELFDAKIEHAKDLSKLRAKHQRMMDIAESARIDSIRQVDLTNTANASTQALTAIQTLATTQAAQAETLRAQVANTATQVQATLNGVTADFNKRIATLEQSSYEGAGKQKVADPASERTAMLVERLVAAQAAGAGKSEGLSQGWAILGGAILLALAIYGGVFKSAGTATAQPQVIYVPAPAVGATGVPTAPAIPR